MLKPVEMIVCRQRNTPKETECFFDVRPATIPEHYGPEEIEILEDRVAQHYWVADGDLTQISVCIIETGDIQ